ncbi:MAG: hypothetical protein AAGI07_06775 [Bacteroidota bacterium]
MLVFLGCSKSKKENDYSINNKMVDISQLPFTIDTSSDTLLLGEVLNVRIKLLEPRLKNFRVIVGEYDENFEIIDSLLIGVVSGKDSIASFHLNPESKGKKTINGIIEEFEPVGNGYEDTRRYAFEVDFFVLGTLDW